MAKAKKPQNKRKKAQAAASNPAKAAPTRRNILAMAPYVLGGVVVAGGLGFWGVSSVRADLAEQDLSIIGTGQPSIIQVHDPSCATCMALQREARAALHMLDTDQVAYRVAALQTDVGALFAQRYNAGHATLLFFDGAGNLTNAMQGMANRDALLTAFQAHIAAES